MPPPYVDPRTDEVNGARALIRGDRWVDTGMLRHDVRAYLKNAARLVVVGVELDTALREASASADALAAELDRFPPSPERSAPLREATHVHLDTVERLRLTAEPSQTAKALMIL